MNDDDATIEQTAREMISRDGTAAASIAREWRKSRRSWATGWPPKTWRDIADEIERQSRQEAAARCKGREG
jgi:hypothetical protein